MKNIIKTSILTVFAFISMTLLCIADQAYPRPAFMPSTPPATKEIADYTTANMLGAVITSSEDIPLNHKYRLGQFKKGLKASWPGVKDATKIDEMVQIVLDAPATANIRELDILF